MGFWSSLGSSVVDNATSGIMGNMGVVDYLINPLAQAGYDEWWSDSRENSLKNRKAELLQDLEFFPLFVDAEARAMPKMLGAYRSALEQNGYNPILAVNSSAGSLSSSGVPLGSLSVSDAPRSSVRGSTVMDNLAKASMINQTNAQTDLIKKRTEGEGWQIKTLSRSEAQGLGANLVHTLGFNFHDSSQQTFLVAYNPITGELRNLGDTGSGLGSTAPVSNAAEVNSIPIDWKTDKSPRYKFNPDDWELKQEYQK